MAVEHPLTISVSPRHINRLRTKWNLNRPKGRLRQATGGSSEVLPATTVEVMPRMSFVGVHLFVHWLQQHDAFAPPFAPPHLGHQGLYRPSGFKPLFSLKLEVPVDSVSAIRGSGCLLVAKTDHELGCEMTS